MPNFSLPDSVFEAAAARYPTPFHLYDERGIRENARALQQAFAWCEDFEEYFAVKALPNPAILRILREEGFGVQRRKAEYEAGARLLADGGAGGLPPGASVTVRRHQAPSPRRGRFPVCRSRPMNCHPRIRSEKRDLRRYDRMPESSETLSWYHENAEAFIDRTAAVDLSGLYRTFLACIPSGGSIMDLGCGAGSAALFFARMGCQVLAVDGCRELCDFTQRRVGCPVRCLRFEELDYEDAFDGIWACASLLHVRKADLPRVLRLIRRALKTGGVLYASFKYGEAERKREGRFFADYTEASLRAVLEEAGGFREIRLWTTGDALSDRADQRWLNVLCSAG